MNEQSRLRTVKAEAVAAGERSRADIAAGRVEEFDVVMTELRVYLDEKMKTRKGNTQASQD